MLICHAISLMSLPLWWWQFGHDYDGPGELDFDSFSRLHGNQQKQKTRVDHIRHAAPPGKAKDVECDKTASLADFPLASVW